MSEIVVNVIPRDRKVGTIVLSASPV